MNPHSLANQAAIATTNINKYKLSQKLGLRLAHSNWECLSIYLHIYHRTLIYKFTISLFTIPVQSEQELYVWREHA